MGWRFGGAALLLFVACSAPPGQVGMLGDPASDLAGPRGDGGIDPRGLDGAPGPPDLASPDLLAPLTQVILPCTKGNLTYVSCRATVGKSCPSAVLEYCPSLNVDGWTDPACVRPADPCAVPLAEPIALACPPRGSIVVSTAGCKPELTECLLQGRACMSGSECCSGSCIGRVCAGPCQGAGRTGSQASCCSGLAVTDPVTKTAICSAVGPPDSEGHPNLSPHRASCYEDRDCRLGACVRLKDDVIPGRSGTCECKLSVGGSMSACTADAQCCSGSCLRGACNVSSRLGDRCSQGYCGEGSCRETGFSRAGLVSRHCELPSSGGTLACGGADADSCLCRTTCATCVGRDEQPDSLRPCCFGPSVLLNGRQTCPGVPHGMPCDPAWEATGYRLCAGYCRADGICAALEPNDPCTLDVDCRTGKCVARRCAGQALGTACRLAEQCDSLVCSQGVCQPRAIGADCSADAQCDTGWCRPRANATATCQRRCALLDSACQADADCCTGSCQGGVCVKVGVGAPCYEGLECVTAGCQGTCQCTYSGPCLTTADCCDPPTGFPGGLPTGTYAKVCVTTPINDRSGPSCGCRTSGQRCGATSDCCAGAGACLLRLQPTDPIPVCGCRAPGAACGAPDECCDAPCVKASAAGPSSCGCHALGDYCEAASDCCPRPFVSCEANRCACTPQCATRPCGPDGCGGTCPSTCASNQVCVGNTCCTPSCTGKACGPDGCGGSCPNTCGSNQVCVGNACCTPSCAGKACGPDGCGGSCPNTCGSNQACVGNGCCTRQCPSGSCGSDGCGGTCACPSGTRCLSGQCLASTAGCDARPGCVVAGVAPCPTNGNYFKMHMANVCPYPVKGRFCTVQIDGNWQCTGPNVLQPGQKQDVPACGPYYDGCRWSFDSLDSDGCFPSGYCP